MRRIKRFAKWGCGIYVAIAVIAIIVYFVTPDNDTEPQPVAIAPTATATSAEPLAFAPSDIIVATATLTPMPTQPDPPTVVPTVTPLPTPTPDNALTIAEQEYAEKAAEIGRLYSEGMQTVGEAMTEMGSNPALLFDEDWKWRVIGGETKIFLANEMVNSLNPSPRFQPVHAELELAAGYFGQAIDRLNEGLDNIDASKIEAAGGLLALGTDALNRATTKAGEILP